MFISSYQALREKIIDEHTLSSLVQLEYSGFDGATVPICTYTLRKRHIPGYVGDFVRLSDFRGAANQGPKTLEAADPNCAWRYRAKPEDFEKIPGSPIAYWVSSKALQIFQTQPKLSDFGEAMVGVFTCNNDRFIRQWFEVGWKTENSPWQTHSKGGNFRKWYGNLAHVLRYEDSGEQRVRAGQSKSLSGEAFYYSRHKVKATAFRRSDFIY